MRRAAMGRPLAGKVAGFARINSHRKKSEKTRCSRAASRSSGCREMNLIQGADAFAR